jgi:hypothetical protein
LAEIVTPFKGSINRSLGRLPHRRRWPRIAV